MIRKNKIIMVRTWTNAPYQESFAKKLTVASVQRINMDNLILSMILRKPQHLPFDLSEDDFLNRKVFSTNMQIFLNHIESNEKHFLILSEYGDLLAERDDLKIINGFALNRDWLYSSIKALHKNASQQVIEVDLFKDKCTINGQDMELSKAFQFLDSSM